MLCISPDIPVLKLINIRRLVGVSVEIHIAIRLLFGLGVEILLNAYVAFQGADLWFILVPRSPSYTPPVGPGPLEVLDRLRATAESGQAVDAEVAVNCFRKVASYPVPRQLRTCLVCT